MDPKDPQTAKGETSVKRLEQLSSTIASAIKKVPGKVRELLSSPYGRLGA